MEEEKLRKKYVMAAKKAPAKVFADGKNGMTVDDIRKEVVKYYEKWYIDDLEYFEREKEDDPFTMMSKRAAVNTILRATAINFSYIKEIAVIGKFYDFLNKVQDTENVDVNVEYSSIVDWYITLYDLENFSLINFDNVKVIQIWPFDGKFRIQVKLTKSDELIGTTLAAYNSADDAKRELERFYKAYNSGEKTFAFKNDEPKQKTEENGSREEL